MRNGTSTNSRRPPQARAPRADLEVGHPGSDATVDERRRDSVTAASSRRDRRSGWQAVGMADPSSAELPLPPVERVRPGSVEHPGSDPQQPAALRPGLRLRNRPRALPDRRRLEHRRRLSTPWSPAWTRPASPSATCKGVLVTHIHPDHYGLAGRIREASGAWVALHPADAAPDRVPATTSPTSCWSRWPAMLRRDGSPAEEEIAACSRRRCRSGRSCGRPPRTS